jgi:hypothetical protein
VDLNQVLRQLIELRAQSWRLHLLNAEVVAPPEPMLVLASRGHIEQALLSLLVHAEQALDGAEEKTLRISAAAAQGTARIEIAFSAAGPAGSDLEAGMWGLGVTRGLIESHGGELRLREDQKRCTIVVNMPLTQAQPGASRAAEALPARPLTLLLVHPELQQLRPVIVQLGGLDQRAIPAASGQEAIEMASRIHFDAVFAARHLPDLAWQDFAARVREHCTVTGMLTTASDHAPAGLLALPLSADESALRGTLLAVESAA